MPTCIGLWCLSNAFNWILLWRNLLIIPYMQFAVVFWPWIDSSDAAFKQSLFRSIEISTAKNESHFHYVFWWEKYDTFLASKYRSKLRSQQRLCKCGITVSFLCVTFVTHKTSLDATSVDAPYYAVLPFPPAAPDSSRARRRFRRPRQTAPKSAWKRGETWRPSRWILTPPVEFSWPFILKS